MKRKITRVLAIVLALTTILATGAMAADVDNGPNVRVNGVAVEFPDAKPYIDENSRTMIPVRFATEQLGAKVTWDGKTKTASIAKNGVTVNITIGSPDLRITEKGKTETVKMDTAAVLRDDRTYVPIRYVAEALGAYVDYSSTHKTVGIYNENLTAEQIKELQALPYTQPDYAISYETAKKRYDAESLAFYYGTDRDSFQSFANAREHLYSAMKRNGTYYFKELGVTLKNSDNDTFFRKVVEEAKKEVSYSSERLTVEFITDTSCIYQADTMDRLTCAVRGIAKVRLNVKPTELEGAETALLCKLGFTQLYQGVDMYIPADVHMNTQPDYNVNVHTIVPAGTAY